MWMFRWLWIIRRSRCIIKRYLNLIISQKMFDYMACQRPVIVGVDGEARSLVERSKAGIFVEPENTEQMAQAILRLKRSPDLCLSMGKSGREFVKRYFSRKQKAFELERVLQEIV